MEKLFGIAELKDPKVRLLGAVLLLISMMSFALDGFNLVPVHLPDNGMVCPPYFDSCDTILRSVHAWLNTSFGMNSMRFPAAIALIPIELGLISLAIGAGTMAWVCLLLVFVWRAIAIIGFQFPILNFDFYDIVFLFVFLFARDKWFASKLLFVVLYFVSSTVKLDNGWISGDYFLTLKEGLPLLGQTKWAVILVTNVVILLQIFAGWGLFSSAKRVRYVAFCLFSMFHIYSTAVVGLRFPMSTVPLLIVLFAFDLRRPEDSSLKEGLKHIIGRLAPIVKGPRQHLVLTLVILMLFSIQIGKVMIPGNEKLSGEGNTLGLYMFDANHQCSGLIEVSSGQAIRFVQQDSNVYAQNRCTVWDYMQRARSFFCQGGPRPGDPADSKYLFTFYSSVNGSPFYEIVSRVDLCSTPYRMFGPNPWIHLKTDGLKSFKAYENTYGNRSGSGNPLVFDQTREGLRDPMLEAGLHLKRIEPSERPTLGAANKVLQVLYWLLFAGVSLRFFWEYARASKLVEFKK